jgi:hypothetical protein
VQKCREKYTSTWFLHQFWVIVFKKARKSRQIKMATNQSFSKAQNFIEKKLNLISL